MDKAVSWGENSARTGIGRWNSPGRGRKGKRKGMRCGMGSRGIGLRCEMGSRGSGGAGGWGNVASLIFLPQSL